MVTTAKESTSGLPARACGGRGRAGAGINRQCHFLSFPRIPNQFISSIPWRDRERQGEREGQDGEGCPGKKAAWVLPKALGSAWSCPFAWRSSLGIMGKYARQADNEAKAAKVRAGRGGQARGGAGGALGSPEGLRAPSWLGCRRRQRGGGLGACMAREAAGGVALAAGRPLWRRVAPCGESSCSSRSHRAAMATRGDASMCALERPGTAKGSRLWATRRRSGERSGSRRERQAAGGRRRAAAMACSRLAAQHCRHPKRQPTAASSREQHKWASQRSAGTHGR